MVADLLKYQTPIVQEYREIIAIAEAENPEFDGLGFSRAFFNRFIDSMDEYACARWEKILDIQAYPSDTIEDRRFRIKARFNSDLPYTYQKLQEMLATLCGEDGFETELGDYTLRVGVALTSKKQELEVKKLTERIVPANIVLTVYLMYNQHLLYNGRYTHAQMSAFTHRELREEVMEE